MPIHKTVEQIKEFIIPNPYDHNYICSDEEFKKKGIYCSKCGSFHLEIGEYFVSCSCGHKEKKEQAVLRSICEYGVLQNNKDLLVNNLFEFLDQKIPKQFIYRKLQRFFVPITGKSRITCYNNPKMLYEFVFEETKVNGI